MKHLNLLFILSLFLMTSACASLGDDDDIDYSRGKTRRSGEGPAPKRCCDRKEEDCLPYNIQDLQELSYYYTIKDCFSVDVFNVLHDYLKNNHQGFTLIPYKDFNNLLKAYIHENPYSHLGEVKIKEILALGMVKSRLEKLDENDMIADSKFEEMKKNYAPSSLKDYEKMKKLFTFRSFQKIIQYYSSYTMINEKKIDNNFSKKILEESIDLDKVANYINAYLKDEKITKEMLHFHNMRINDNTIISVTYRYKKTGYKMKSKALNAEDIIKKYSSKHIPLAIFDAPGK